MTFIRIKNVYYGSDTKIRGLTAIIKIFLNSRVTSGRQTNKKVLSEYFVIVVLNIPGFRFIFIQISHEKFYLKSKNACRYNINAQRSYYVET